ncbi:MAG: PBSX family phage terminase large subunit [Sphaerochaeta sp.]|jgi:phage terminase large subunit|nr:PBSX family phage terminase large subunit [Sphaerochaeta sp.]
MSSLDLRDYTNRSFDPLFSSRARELVVYGGAGAGKSYAVAQKLIMKALLYPGSRIAVIRKFGPSLKKTCWELTVSLLDKYGIPYKPNLSDLTIELGQSKMEFMPVVNSTGEPAERLKSMTDITDIWIEEATEITPEEYRQIRLRLRGEELKEGYRQIVLSFNPIDRNHWIYAYFFEGSRGEQQHYTHKDNRFIDSDYKAELEGLADEDELLYNVYCLGKWGVLGEIIFTRYEIREFDYPADYYDELLAGCDFGFVHPAAVVFIGLREKTAYIFDEVYERKLVNAELIELIGEKQEQHRLAPAIFCDTAEPGRIEEMARAGLNVWPADKNVADGINTVKGYKLVIHPRCVSTIREIRSYARKKDRAGNVLEEPVKANDHTMDGLRYALHSYEREMFKRNQQQAATVVYDDPVEISPV